MKKYTFILLLLLSVNAWCQDTTSAASSAPADAAFLRHSYVGTVAIGFINGYRSEYSVPANFEKGQSTGFAPIYAKFEYGVSDRVSMALTASFSTVYYNSVQLYTGYHGPIKRDRTNKFRMFSGGLTAYYHFGHLFDVKNLDPFVGLGISLNNSLYSAYPQGDSTVIKKSHSATPYLKAGARYYISDKFSVFGDVGYDKLSIFSLGLSCRFLPAKYRVQK